MALQISRTDSGNAVNSESGLASDTGATDIEVDVRPLCAPENLERTWLDLEFRTQCSPFQTWAWVGTWLENLPRGLEAQVVEIKESGRTIGLGVVSPTARQQFGIRPLARLCLNETGNPNIDPIAIEFNGLLLEQGAPPETLGTAMAEILASRQSPIELCFGGLDETATQDLRRAASDERFIVRIDRHQRCDYVDFMSRSDPAESYLERLSPNARQQVRRALRGYEAFGPLNLTIARDLAKAMEIFVELKDLHQTTWRARSKPGAFAKPFFERFHTDLISKLFPAGGVQLLRIVAGGKTVGCLYNLVKDGVVYAYQSGFDYPEDAKLKPGYVSHYLAIEENRRQGASRYCFMAGDARYKRSLGTDCEEMTWITIQPNTPSFRLENGLRTARRLLSDRLFHRQRTGSV